MASFYAELQVAGTTYPVRSCAYEFTQSTNERGRVAAKVRHGLVRLTLDVPDGDELLSWAATPFKPLAGRVIFRSAQGGAALETLSWEDGQCVGYQEEFLSGSVHEGAYVCHLAIAAPKLTTASGGPASYVSPAAGEHGMPAAAATTVLDAVLLKAEELATGLVKKVITPAGEIGTEILGVSAAAIARAAPLTLGLVLTPTNSRDDPGYISEWEMYRRNNLHSSPVTPAQLRLAQLERLYEQGTLTALEEAELILLLAKVKGIHVKHLSDLPGVKTNGKVSIPIFTPLLPREGDVGTYKDLIDAGTRGDNLTPHHLPSDAYNKQHGIAKKDGVCINMEQPQNGGRHRQTKTFGRNMTETEREAYYKLTPKEALEHDIQDARRIFKEEGKLDAKIEQKLQEVIAQNKAKFPNLYGH
jgi:Hemolysin coregulated protein Hcp (TssD)